MIAPAYIWNRFKFDEVDRRFARGLPKNVKRPAG